MKIFALILFVLMYVLMIAKPKYRPFYALSAALIFLISGMYIDGAVSRRNHNWIVLKDQSVSHSGKP